MPAFFNTGLSQQQFLDQYWQKKPLLIRNAFALPVTDLTPDDLAGFACETDIESRLIRQLSEQQWQLQHGPLDENLFAQLAEQDWTLLVQDMDKHWPALQTLWQPFAFIPDWRRDDIMISYAVPGGSVGAHIDNYDVFLLQAQGIRRWQIADQPEDNPQWLENCDLRILKSFDPQQSWDLQPGDMLYLPPKFAHHGIAQTDCMTISLGFRAPSQRQLLDAFVDALAADETTEGFYSDADLQASRQASQISDKDLQRAKALLLAAVYQHPEVLLKAFGRQVTETKPAVLPWLNSGSEAFESQAQLDTFFQQGGMLTRSNLVRVAWHASAQRVSVFMGGDDYQLPAECGDLVAMLCAVQQLQLSDWQQFKQQPALAALLMTMLDSDVWTAD